MTGREEPAADPRKMARLILLRQLAARSRTQAQLREALRKRNIPEDAAEETLARFLELGLIDDQAYAAELVRSEAERGGLSRRRVRMRLQQHGVEEELVALTVAEIAPEDEERAAMGLARRKAPRWNTLDPVTRRRRLVGVLARRGYGAQTIHRVVHEVLEVDGSEEDQAYG